MNLFILLVAFLIPVMLSIPLTPREKLTLSLKEREEMIDEIDTIFRKEKGLVPLHKYGAAIGFSGQDFFLAVGETPNLFLLTTSAIDFSPGKVYRMLDDESVYLSFLYEVVLYYRTLAAEARHFNQQPEYFEEKIKELRAHIQSIELHP